MASMLTLTLAKDKIRFTPDGSIAVVDAIAALSESSSPARIWETLKRDHPSLETMCSRYTFSEKETLPVADSESWSIIQDLLLDLFVEKGFH